MHYLDKMTEEDREFCVDHVARLAHEVNRSYCRSAGHCVPGGWERCSPAHRASLRKGVVGALEGKNPAQGHAAWLEIKQEEGWVWGPEKDEKLKTHPCMLHYDQLPIDQKVKDLIFLSVVRGFARVLSEDYFQ